MGWVTRVSPARSTAKMRSSGRSLTGRAGYALFQQAPTNQAYDHGLRNRTAASQRHVEAGSGAVRRLRRSRA
jgi:hypothetical protein